MIKLTKEQLEELYKQGMSRKKVTLRSAPVDPKDRGAFIQP